jgi:hypothetical protein
VSDQPNAPDPNTPAGGTPADPAAGAPAPGAPQPASPAPGTPPPATPASAASPPPSTGWPNSAKATTAVLAVLTVGAVILAIVGFSQASNESDDRSDAESGLSEALERAESAESERDELSGQLEESEATIESLTEERDQALADRDEAVAANDQLSTDLAAETERADAAEAQLEEIGESFPIEIAVELDPEVVAGTYRLDVTEVFCIGLAPCGSPPAASQATISSSGGNLTLAIDGVIEAGLANFGGSLYAVGDSSTVYPECPGGPRTARVTVTMWANDVVIAEDGTTTVPDIGGSIAISAAPTGEDCDYGSTFYTATFTPTG